MCEHSKMVDGLNTYFPEYVLLNETVLETLSEDNATGLKCLKEEAIVKCTQLNNLSKHPVKSLLPHLIMTSIYICQYLRLRCTVVPG